jgi:hypothetical protein
MQDLEVLKKYVELDSWFRNLVLDLNRNGVNLNIFLRENQAGIENYISARKSYCSDLYSIGASPPAGFCDETKLIIQAYVAESME